MTKTEKSWKPVGKFTNLTEKANNKPKFFCLSYGKDQKATNESSHEHSKIESKMALANNSKYGPKFEAKRSHCCLTHNSKILEPLFEI